jgi:hypothetical protein
MNTQDQSDSATFDVKIAKVMTRQVEIPPTTA